MSKNKKIIIISSIIAVIVIIVAVLIYCMVFNYFEEDATSKVNKLYTQLQEKSVYSFSITLDEENNMYYAKNDNSAYVDTINKGNESKFIIKDGNSYLLSDDDKTYYTYKNNETELEKIILTLEKLKDMSYAKGKEQIENRQYQYEEYETVTDFSFKNISEQGKQTAKTRFYFDGNKLVYIKTIIGNEQEILKVKISDEVDENLFQIPSDYQNL